MTVTTGSFAHFINNGNPSHMKRINNRMKSSDSLQAFIHSFISTTYSSFVASSTSSSLNRTEKSFSKQQQHDENNDQKQHEQQDEEWKDFRLFNVRRAINMFGLAGFIYLGMIAFYHFKRQEVKNHEMMKVLLAEETTINLADETNVVMDPVTTDYEEKLLNFYKQVLFLIKSFQYIEEFFHPVSFLLNM